MKYLLKKIPRLLLFMVIALILMMIASAIYVKIQLPSVELLKDIRLQVPLRIYTSDGKLIAEFGEKRRIPVYLNEIPPQLINAILATEDQRFYSHPGIDIPGLGRAALQLVRTGDKAQGGSTITMQVARNFFLSNQKTFLRKFNEILLALKIERQLSKEKILELYLNKIYLGNRAYGVGTAAQVYYGKPIAKLNLAQLAMIAGLPKAPSTRNPLANPEAAIERRNHVLKRMYDEGFITREALLQASNATITAQYHGAEALVEAPYVAEMIRQALYNQFEEDAYTNGYQVYTTIDSELQETANKALRTTLLNYEDRHGYRGPLTHVQISDDTNTQDLLSEVLAQPIIQDFYPAAIMATTEKSAVALIHNGECIEIPWSGLSWAKPQLKNRKYGKSPQQTSDILRIGDIVLIHQENDQSWRLTQYPDVEGALVSLEPNDGAIVALVGGFDYSKSHFNRITQATRQPGSSFKPLIYAAALNKGLTLATLINDAPVVLDDPSLENVWRPQNDSRMFYGLTRLRTGLTRSRNIVSIRLLENIGIPYTIDFISRFGFNPNDLPRSLSLALGSLSISPLDLTAAFSVFANGGYKVEPYLINQITNDEDEVLLQTNAKTACTDCNEADLKADITLEQYAPRIVNRQVAYLMTLALKDAIKSGTGRPALALKRNDIAGKTGTTNDQKDAWFVGFNGDLVTTTWMGYDQPQSLGEYSVTTALPMWMNFMQTALAGKVENSLIQPPGLISVRIDPTTGLLARHDQKDSIFETFRREYAPINQSSRDNYYQNADESKKSTSGIEYLF
ncbi:MAG: penicillin-binding protein 1A [Gammaproteobacteria bacterium]